MKNTIILLLLSLIVLLSPVLMAQNKIFWTDIESDVFGEFDLDTQTLTELYRGPGDLRASAFALDTLQDRLFWVSRTELRMADLSSGQAETLYTLPETGSEYDMEYSYDSDAVFISEFGDQVIYKYDLTSNEGSVFLNENSGVGFPSALVALTDRLLWTTSGDIYQVDFDGSNQQIFADLSNSVRPDKFAIDEAGGWLYFNDRGSFGGAPSLKRLDLSDPSTIETIVELTDSDDYAQGMVISQKQNRLFWIDRFGFLFSSAPDGSGIDTLATFLDRESDINNLEVSDSNDQIYYSGGIVYEVMGDSSSTVLDDVNLGTVRVDSLNNRVLYTANARMYSYSLSDQSISPFFGDDSDILVGAFEIDAQDEKIFWNSLSSIYSVDFDGTSADTLLMPIEVTGLISGTGIDPRSNTFYFSDNASTTQGNLKSISYDGSTLDTLIFAGLDYPAGLSVDPINQYLYWRESNFSSTSRIVRTDLTGSMKDTLLTAAEDGIENPLSIVPDPVSQKLYWLDASKNQIWRSDLNGDNPEAITEIISSNLYDFDILSTATTTNNEGSDQPERFSLEQNYPNPFNPSTTISFTIPVQSRVTLEVFDITGRQVADLIRNEVHSAGSHNVRFNATGLASGMYLYRLHAGTQVLTSKMMLIK